MTQPSDSELKTIVDQVLARLQPESTATNKPPASGLAAGGRLIAIGADHGGFELKGLLLSYLREQGYETLDCGAFNTEAVDYPDLAEAVARKVASSEAWRGIVIDGAGIGSCMAANKIPGVRAAMCYDHASAVNSREHNNANLLTMGAGMIGSALAKQIASTWLKTEFAGGRHARRVEKIMALESYAYAR